jgi:plastocyanin
MPSRPQIALLLLLVLAAGCGEEKASPGSGGAGGTATDPASASGGDTVKVAMKDILFVPEKISGRVGQTVVWTNEDDIVHTVKAEKGADFESKAVSKGKTYKAKLTKTGTIAYVCTIHPSQRGTITVAAQ